MAHSDTYITGKPLTGRKVFAIAACAFGIIIAVNLLLAFKAVSTFPGLETRNSYIVSQEFDADRAAQVALGWTVSAVLSQGTLTLRFDGETGPAQPEIVSAVIGRATHVNDDQFPNFVFDGDAFTAPVSLGSGNWNLRVQALAEDGTKFRQRIVVDVRS